MRFYFFVLFIILISCGSSAENGASEKEDTPEPGLERAKEQAVDISGTNYRDYTIPDPLKGGPADIKVSINGLPPGGYRLIGFYAEGHFLADSVKADPKGFIRIKNPDSYPQGLYYLAFDNNKYVQLILGEDQKFELEADLADIQKTVRIEGSTENEEFYASLQYELEFTDKHIALTNRLQQLEMGTERNNLNKEKIELEKEREAYLDKLFKDHPDLLFTKFKKAGQNPMIRTDVGEDEKVYYYRKDFWENVDFSDRRLIRTPVIINKLKRYMKELTAQNQDSIYASAKMLIDQTVDYPEYFKFFANWVVIQYEPTKTTLMDPESVFVNMVRRYFTQDLAFWSDSMEVYAIQQRAHEMGQSLLGQKGPNVISNAPDGSKKELYAMEADYLIVYLFNPTCEHCMVQTPKLVNWYNKNKDKDVDVYAIAIDTDEAEWKEYIREKNMNFTNVFDPTNRSIYAKYYVDVTPEIYVLNKDRTIIGKNLKVDQIDIILNRDREKNKS